MMFYVKTHALVSVNFPLFQSTVSLSRLSVARTVRIYYGFTLFKRLF